MNGRYDRQLPVFGEEGQERIQTATVGIAGCGGLGVNVITQLTEAGVSAFILCDPQTPDVTNLNRQFIYSPADYRPKAQVAGEWILALNPMAMVESHAQPLTEDNMAIFRNCDVVVDCLDNFESRMVLSDLSEKTGIPLVHAGVAGMQGQIAVCIPGKTPSLRDMIGTMKDPEGPVPSVGAAVSVIAGMEALEALKVISGMGSEDAGKLVTVDMSTWTTETVDFMQQ